eukprot:4975245-Pyramimonas_sp.AAC.1
MAFAERQWPRRGCVQTRRRSSRHAPRHLPSQPNHARQGPRERCRCGPDGQPRGLLPGTHHAVSDL